MSKPLKVSSKKYFDENRRTFDERKQELEDISKRESEEREREKQSPYSNWYQFNRDHTKEMIWLATNHPKAQAMLLFLLEQMDNYNAVMCSYLVFQEALSISKQTITRSIKVLKDNGFLHIMKSGTSNIYVINNDLAWSSWGKNFKYCKFPANIVLSAGENREYFSKIDYTNIKQVEIQDNEKNTKVSENDEPASTEGETI